MNSKLKYQAASILGGAAAALISSGLAQAQADGEYRVEEVVVTAQRQAQNLLSVPQSVTAFSGAELAASGIKDLTSLQQTTPGFVPIDNSGSVLIFVRGVGNALFTGADPSVATYIDDVPRIWGTMVNALVDVERVELLKGAQGGLYGRNATGGVLSIITRQPSTSEFAGKLRLSYGTRDSLNIAGSFNVPFSDRVALDLGIQHTSHEPYVKNIVTSRTPYTAAMFPTGSRFGTPQQTADAFNSTVGPMKGYNNEDLWAVNGKLLLQATDTFKITFAGDYSHRNDSNGTGGTNLHPAFAQGVASNLFRAFGVNAVLPPGFIYSTDEKYKTAGGALGNADLEDYGVSATAVLSLPAVDLTSISAYRRQTSYFLNDITSANVPILVSDSTKYFQFFYQEVRAVTTGDGPLKFLGGATYLWDRTKQTGNTSILPPLGIGAITTATSVVKNWSVYGQLTYALTDHFEVTASGRYIHETNDTLFTAPGISSTASTQKKFLPSATISYKFDGGGNAYARFARGFKGGGVNPVVPPSAFPGNEGSVFGPETLDTYEVGYRAPLFDRKVQVTSAIFYNDYKDLQVLVRGRPAFPQIVYAIANAGTARTYGAEGSVTWRVSRPLTLGVSGGYLNAKYKKVGISTSSVLAPFDRSGQQMLNAPKWQLALSGKYDQPISDEYHLVADVLASYSSKILFAQSGLAGTLPDGVQPSYWLANARLSLRTTDDRRGVAIFVNNLFNKSYATYIGSSGSTGNVYKWGAPRVVGVELEMNF